jgi:hypothetical protein
MQTKMTRLQELMLEIDEVLRDEDELTSHPLATSVDSSKQAQKENSKSGG